MNPTDVKKAGFSEHQRVTVKGDAAQLEGIEIICGGIREGTAFMFYPEANILFHAVIEQNSGTPAYKRVPIGVFPEI